MMRKGLWVLLAATLVVVGSVAAGDGHSDDHGSVAVKGEILDLACYVGHEAKGPGHADCAKRCVKGGQPMGLLAEDGTLYLLVANHQDGTPYEAAKDKAGEIVTVRGVVSERGGMRALEVQAVEG